MDVTTAKRMQPKFDQCVFDGDKTPKNFLVWIRLVGGIVYNIPFGNALEAFLDSYLEREEHIASTRPSFLDDDLIDIPELKKKKAPEEGGEVTVLRTEKTKYSDLPEEAVQLDKTLFYTLMTIVRGSYLLLISDLTGEYARYTFAIIALWNHANLSACNRRIEAMTEMANLTYHGDAGKWKLDFISKAREIYQSRATIEHYIMHCAFKSFEGKNAQVQGMITQDINDADTVCSGMSIEGLATKYSSFLSTLTSSSQHRINTVKKKKWCTNCESYSHNTEDCFSAPGPETEEASEEDKPQRRSKKLQCEFCERHGHLEKDCRFKAKLKKKTAEVAEAESPEEEPEEDAKKANNLKVSTSEINAIMGRLTGKTRM